MNPKPPVLTFFNNTGGVGKTSLIYHLAWMFAILRKRVLAVDIDPQSNLTAAFIEEDTIEKIWNDQQAGTTIFHCIKPLTEKGDVVEPILQEITNNLYLIPGNIALSKFEETLSAQWPDSMGDANLYRPMSVLSAFWQVMQTGAQKIEADIILVDIDPTLGAINRSALIASDYVIIPLGADLFSLQGLKNLGPTLRSWNKLWNKRLENWRSSKEHAAYADFELPKGDMRVIGYVCQQHGVRLERPLKACDKWVNQIPEAYRTAVLGQQAQHRCTPADDPECLAITKHYRSLMSMGQEHRKPIFKLTPADGAVGSHASAAQDAKKDFEELALKIEARMELQ